MAGEVLVHRAGDWHRSTLRIATTLKSLIMNATPIVSFRDYDLQCGTRAAEPGMFAPTLVVSRRTWPSRPRVIAMSRGSFATEADAIDSARAQGVQWVTDFG